MRLLGVVGPERPAATANVALVKTSLSDPGVGDCMQNYHHGCACEMNPKHPNVRKEQGVEKYKFILKRAALADASIYRHGFRMT